MPVVRPEQVTLLTFPDPEQAPDQLYEVIGEPPSPFDDQVQVSCPGLGPKFTLRPTGAGVKDMLTTTAT